MVGGNYFHKAELTFHRAEFPPTGAIGISGQQERARKLQAPQIIAFRRSVAKRAGAGPKPPRERWESQVESDCCAAEFSGSQAAFPRRSHSTPWQTPGTHCLCRRGCGRRREWPKEAWTTFSVRYPAWPRPCRPFPNTI